MIYAPTAAQVEARRVEQLVTEAKATADKVAPFNARRETCACGEHDLVDTDVVPDEIDERFLHAREICFLLDDEEPLS